MPADSSHPLVAAVQQFVEGEVLPVASELEHADAYPQRLVDRMRDLGLFGALVPVGWGGLGLDVSTYARIIEELSRAWMSLAGVINSHTMAALIVLHYGTDEQRGRFLPRLARGEARGGLGLTEPHAGSDVQAIRMAAKRRGDDYVLNGTKMFVTNGREGNAFAVLAVTDPAARPPHRGMSCFIVEKGHPGLRVAQSIAKLGYKGVDTAELVFEDVAVPAANLVGGVEGRGFKHVMSGLETGRINIAARAVGVAQAAFDGAAAIGENPPPPALADMAARLEAARQLTYWAAGLKDSGERCDLEAGMAKLFASETAQALAQAAMEIQGESATWLRWPLERFYRDTPLMIIGEGTNEIQRTLIARQLVQRYGERLGALTSRQLEPDDRRSMVLAVRQFVEKEVVSAAAEHERADRYPQAIVRGLGDLGLLGALVPTAYGGLGLDLPTYAMIVEELARGWTTVAGLVTTHAVTAWAIARFAAATVGERFLPPLARGDMLGAAALDTVAGLERRRTDYRLDGVTGLVDHARRAELFLVRVSVSRDQDRLLLVGKATSGFRPNPPRPTLGGRGLEAATLEFDASVPEWAVLGSGERDDRAPSLTLALARLGVAATAVGLGQAAFEAALRYSQQRMAFGVPICQHQAIQLKLADMATAITAARCLTYHAAERLEVGAHDDEERTAALARLTACRMASDVTLDAMRIHGGYGYTADFPVERYYRDAPRLLLMLGGLAAERRDLARLFKGGCPPPMR